MKFLAQHSQHQLCIVSDQWMYPCMLNERIAMDVAYSNLNDKTVGLEMTILVSQIAILQVLAGLGFV